MVFCKRTLSLSPINVPPGPSRRHEPPFPLFNTTPHSRRLYGYRVSGKPQSHESYFRHLWHVASIANYGRVS